MFFVEKNCVSLQSEKENINDNETYNRFHYCAA